MAHDIEVNLHEDWTTFQRAQLVAIGSLPPDDPEELSFAYWNILHRDVARTQRRVLLSNVIAASPRKLRQCWELRSKLEKGLEVATHLSRAARDPSHPYFHDRLLNDWGLQHFHLGPQGDRRFNSREVVFALVDRSRCFLVDVGDHTDWGRQGLLDTIDENWPGILPGELKGVVHADRFTDQEVLGLRGKPARGTKPGRGGISYPLARPDGRIMLSPGGGYTTTGLSTRVLMTSDAYFDHLRRNEEFILKDPHVNQRIAGDQGELQLRLLICPLRRWLALDSKRKLGVWLEPIQSHFPQPWLARDLRFPRKMKKTLLALNTVSLDVLGRFGPRRELEQ